MFPSALTADDVCHVYWQRMFSEPVNDLQCSSLRQKKEGLCVCLMCAMSVCGRLWKGVCSVCALLMSHDFPVSGALQNYFSRI